MRDSEGFRTVKCSSHGFLISRFVSFRDMGKEFRRVSLLDEIDSQFFFATVALKNEEDESEGVQCHKNTIWRVVNSSSNRSMAIVIPVAVFTGFFTEFPLVPSARALLWIPNKREPKMKQKKNPKKKKIKTTGMRWADDTERLRAVKWWSNCLGL